MKTTKIIFAVVAVVMALTFVLAGCKPSTTQQTTYSISKATTSNGTFELNVNGKVVSSAKSGEKITVVPSASEGYTVDKVYYKTASSNSTDVTLTDGQYTFSMPADNITVYVEFKLSTAVTYTVSKAQSENGSFTLTVNGTEVSSAESGQEITVTALPDEGFVIDKIHFTTAVNQSENEVVASDGVYSFVMPESDVTVYVVFVTAQPTTHKLSKESDSNVTLLVDGENVETPVDVKQSSTVTVQFDVQQYVAMEVYYTTSNGKVEVLPAEGIYSFAMPDDDVTVGAMLVKTTDTSAVTFEYLEDSNSYSVSGYTGVDSDVVIPRVYEGLPVTQIGSYALLSTSVKSVVIHSDITVIDMYALSSCVELTTVRFEKGSKLEIIGDAAFMSSGLTSIEIPSSVKQIGIQTFDSCIDLTSVVFEKGSQLQSVGGNAFGSTAITSIRIPASVTSFDCAFNDCRQLVTVVFEGNNITEITDYTFMNCLKLQSIVLPASVNSIGSKAFFMCNSPLVVYYGGTQTQWEQLENKPQSTPYFYSETKPQESGNCWHFGENGAPVVWEI